MKKVWLCSVLCVGCLLLTGCRTYEESVSSVYETETTARYTSTAVTATATQASKTTTLPTAKTTTAPQTLTLKDLTYWEEIEYIEIPRTFAPPYNHTAILQKDTAEFRELVALLRQAEGSYIGSSQGLYGMYGVMKPYADGKQVDTIVIGMGKEDAYFSTDIQREPSSNPNVSTLYRSRYAMPPALASQLQEFLKSLTYTANS